jgi:hypothetical protein
MTWSKWLAAVVGAALISAPSIVAAVSRVDLGSSAGLGTMTGSIRGAMLGGFGICLALGALFAIVAWYVRAKSLSLATGGFWVGVGLAVAFSALGQWRMAQAGAARNAALPIDRSGVAETDLSRFRADRITWAQPLPPDDEALRQLTEYQHQRESLRRNRVGTNARE